MRNDCHLVTPLGSNSHQVHTRTHTPSTFPQTCFSMTGLIPHLSFGGTTLVNSHTVRLHNSVRDKNGYIWNHGLNRGISTRGAPGARAEGSERGAGLITVCLRLPQ
ncbi:unnamed protein product [Protopolystoma xenopodis]|uniref:Uncharacterized protein n=1 Tax=Protopolystoma xenopodis TaxID=117903 RepID=A0A3S5CGU2_9PLAT|nr:unnamed protein product [Protopolystoma xenopodis]